MGLYLVTIVSANTYEISVEAQDEDEAEEKAYDILAGEPTVIDWVERTPSLHYLDGSTELLVITRVS